MTMREKLAQAAIKELNRQDDQHHGLQDLNKVVDAILAEMETPSDGVIQAGWESGAMVSIDGGDTAYLDSAEVTFSAMIRAIREGK